MAPELVPLEEGRLSARVTGVSDHHHRQAERADLGDHRIAGGGDDHIADGEVALELIDSPEHHGVEAVIIGRAAQGRRGAVITVVVEQEAHVAFDATSKFSARAMTSFSE